jgi:N utilization substance protein A
VWSNDHNVDPVGACVGARGGRVRMVVNELRGEKIDIVPFSEDLADFVAKALSPAKVKEVIISDDLTQADVIVPDQQLSLAIGKEGQNARLAARLTGVRIDIRGETQPIEVDDGVVYEEGEWLQNAETGEMEWHAADGSVITQDQWNAQAAATVETEAEVEVETPVEAETTPDADDVAEAVSDAGNEAAVESTDEVPAQPASVDGGGGDA